MNCAEVQKYLSDFLDKSLDIEHTREIEDHLAACSLCSEEMASLAECHRLVSGLAAVEPPVGFTTRVMVEVRKAANPPGLWQRLFLPLQIKIPLQATAVVLIGVLATYIYQKESLQRESVVAVPPESKQDETDKLAPSVAQAPAGDSKRGVVADKGKMRVQEQESKDSGQLKKPQLLSQPEEPQKPIASNQLAAPQAARSQEQARYSQSRAAPRKTLSSERGCLRSPGTISISGAGKNGSSASSTARKGKCFKRRRGFGEAIVGSGNARSREQCYLIIPERSEIRHCGWRGSSRGSGVGRSSQGTGTR